MSARHPVASIEALRQIVAEKQAARLSWPSHKGSQLVDGFTASAIVKVHDAVKPESQQKLAELVARSPGHFLQVAKIVMQEVI